MSDLIGVLQISDLILKLYDTVLIFFFIPVISLTVGKTVLVLARAMEWKTIMSTFSYNL